MAASTGVYGQSLVYEFDFSEFKDTEKYQYGDNKFTLLGNNSAKPDGWEFENYCYAMNDGTLLLGNSANGTGTCTMPSMNYNGYIQLVFYLRGYEDEEAEITVKATDGGNTVSSVTTAITSTDYHCQTVKINGCTNSTKLKISNNSQRCRIDQIRVYSMDNLLFYESFDKMVVSNPGKAANCDNNGTVFTDNTQGRNGYLFFSNANNSKYELPTLTTISSSDAILSFISMNGNSGFMKSIKITCEGGATLSIIDNSFKLLSSTEAEISSTINSEEWEEHKILLKGLGNTTNINFYGGHINFDNVAISLPIVSIDEGTSNESTINSSLGQRHVQLSRTLKSGIWNTLCLPFDVTADVLASTFGTTAEIQTLASVSTDGIFHFGSIGSATTVAAGTPFLLKVGADVSNPFFSDVTLKATAAGTAEASSEDYKFVGTYSPVSLETDGTNLFLTTAGKLSSPATGSNRLNGLRGYFVVPDAANPARVSLGGTQDAITAIECGVTAGSIVDLQGRRHSEGSLGKGIYIKGNRKIIVR
jgi:hypothetical protein